jgi:transposase
VSDSQEVIVDKLVPAASSSETVPPKRRRYSAAYKRRVIEQADGCTAPGALAMLLRREGIYSSTLQDFRRQLSRGDLDAKLTTPNKPDSSASSVSAEALKELAASERENRRLRRELEKARALLDLQKKVSELMGLSLSLEE